MGEGNLGELTVWAEYEIFRGIRKRCSIENFTSTIN